MIQVANRSKNAAAFLILGSDKITAKCYKYSFGAQFIVVLKNMVKEINTTVKKYSG